MSIIHDALKKVQVSLGKKTDAVSETLIPESIETAPMAPPVVTEPPKQSHMVTVIIIIVALSAGGYLIYQQRDQFAPQLKKLAAKAAPARPITSGPLAKISTSSQAPNQNNHSPEELSVQGIMSNNGSAVALINGKIYAQGDFIAGIKITAINTDGITLLKDGKEEKIQVRH